MLGALSSTFFHQVTGGAKAPLAPGLRNHASVERGAGRLEVGFRVSGVACVDLATMTLRLGPGVCREMDETFCI